MHYRVIGLFLLLLGFILPVGAQNDPIHYDQPRFILETDSDIGSIVDLDYSPDGSLLAAAGSKAIALWDTVTGEVAAQFEVDKPVARFAFSPHGDLLAIYGQNNVRIWNIDTSAVRADFATEQPVVEVAVSPDGTQLGLAHGTGVSLLNLPFAETGDLRIHTFVADDGQNQRNWDAVAFDPTGQYLAAGFVAYGGPVTDFTISMWDVNTYALVREFDLQSSFAVTDLEFNASGTLLGATGGFSTIWNVNTGDALYVTIIDTRGSILPEAGISFNGDYLIISDVAPSVGTYEITSLRDAQTGALLALFQQSLPKIGGGGGDGIFYHPVVFHPAGTQFATLDRGGQVVVWDMPTDFTPTDAPVNIVAYCDDLPATPERPTAADDVNIIWSWYATDVSLITDHMGWSTYAVTLDGRSLDVNAARYSVIRRDPVNDNHWTVYYTLNVGALTPGVHTITYALTWGHAISDGLSDFGPGTANVQDTGTCTFEVDG